MSDQKPQIGTAVYILKDGKVLLGKRLSAAGKGTWCPPGGKLELNELVVECAKREAKEETGLELKTLKFINFTDDIGPGDNPHFVTLHFSTEWMSGNPKVTEPDKFETWDWFEWNDLPSPLFRPVENFIKSGFNPSNI